MLTVETFYFNPYRECTYVLANDHQQAVIIDAGMYEAREQQRFAQYIQTHHLTPVALLITHAHPDHVCGLEYLEQTYGLSAVIQPAQGTLPIEGFNIQVISTPGHKEDCVCYYLPEEDIIFTGDTLFQESIGRTDLPGGDMHQLMLSLRKLVVLPEQTKVYPGHGYPTSIAHERQYNPYL
jgi:glyoxylase-like metal-dependent hydrolase (beta-lactamase superfamily II)